MNWFGIKRKEPLERGLEQVKRLFPGRLICFAESRWSREGMSHYRATVFDAGANEVELFANGDTIDETIRQLRKTVSG